MRATTRRRIGAAAAVAMALSTTSVMGAAAAHAAPPGGTPIAVTVAGVDGVPADADAVVLNVTATGATAPGYVTAYPCGSAVPGSSNVNFGAGETIPNLVIAKVGVGGQMCLVSNTATDLVVDLAGYFPAGSGFQPTADPQRLADTRTGVGTNRGPIDPDGRAIGVAG